MCNCDDLLFYVEIFVTQTEPEPFHGPSRPLSAASLLATESLHLCTNSHAHTVQQYLHHLLSYNGSKIFELLEMLRLLSINLKSGSQSRIKMLVLLGPADQDNTHAATISDILFHTIGHVPLWQVGQSTQTQDSKRRGLTFHFALIASVMGQQH